MSVEFDVRSSRITVVCKAKPGTTYVIPGLKQD
jgi:hypothetical protein